MFVELPARSGGRAAHLLAVATARAGRSTSASESKTTMESVSVSRSWLTR